MIQVLIAALLALPASAAPACKGYDSLHLDEAVTKAHELTSSCLIKGGLNPELGKRMLAAENVAYRCDYEMPEYAKTTRPDDGPPNVAVDVSAARPDSLTSVAEPRPLDMTIFHELLHVGDPGHDSVFSIASHNRGLGFPDGIYGCEYACGKGIDPNAMGRAYMTIFEGLVRQIPEDGGYACEGADCAFLRKYAWLCRNGAPSLSREERQGLHVFEVALCLRQNMTDLLVPKTDHPLAKETYQAFSDAVKFSDEPEARRAKMMIGFSKVVVDAMNAGWQEKLWFSMFLDRNDCPSLPD